MAIARLRMQRPSRTSTHDGPAPTSTCPAMHPPRECNRGHRPRRLPIPPMVGFTLIEILVVLAIVGVLVLAVSIGVATAGGERQLAREAERLQALVSHACTRAELGGREIGVRVDAEGYAFMMLGLDGWMADEREGELRPRRWIRGLRVEMLRDGRPLRTAGSGEQGPQIVCFSSGELSPFELTLALGEGDAKYALRGRIDGRIDMQRTPEPR